MGAAAEWTAGFGTLRPRPRAALSRSPGAPLPGLLPRNILKRLRRRGVTVRVICLVVLAGPSPATPKKGVSLHTWAQAQDLLVD